MPRPSIQLNLVKRTMVCSPKKELVLDERLVGAEASKVLNSDDWILKLMYHDREDNPAYTEGDRIKKYLTELGYDKINVQSSVTPEDTYNRVTIWGNFKVTIKN
jgi:hypothetical protein